MPIRTDEYDSDSNTPTGLYVLLRIAHTEKYPDELPDLDVEESDNMTEEDIDELKIHLTSMVRKSNNKNCGLYHIFFKSAFIIITSDSINFSHQT